MLIHAHAGLYDDVAQAAQHVIAEAGISGEARLVRQGAAAYAVASVLGTTPVAEALGTCQRALEEVRGDRLAEGVVSGALAQLRAMQGDFDEARVRYGEEMRLLADLGVNSQSASTSLDSARVEVLAGDLAAAESHLRRDDAQLAELGEHYFRSEVAGMLGRVLMLRGDAAEAQAFVVLAEALSDADDAGSQVLCGRSARARLLATSNPQRALELARGGVDIAETTADLLLRGDAWSDLGEVHLDASGMDDAMGALEHALELYELKGDTTSADRARRRIAELRQSVSSPAQLRSRRATCRSGRGTR